MQTNSNRRRLARSCRPLAVALVQPAVRMVIVEASVNTDDGAVFHQFHPVLALESRVERHFVKGYDGDNEPDDGLTEKGLIEKGWYLSRQDLNRSALYLHSDGYLEADDGQYSDCLNTATRTVVCPRPAAEDEQRLADVVAELTAQARQKVEQYNRERRKEGATT